MSEHTPGPWQTDQTFDVTGKADTKHNATPAISIYGNGSQIALVLGNGNGESASNARLIEAAPDLLEACRLARLALRATSKADKDYSMELELLNKAINFATGEKRRSY